MANIAMDLTKTANIRSLIPHDETRSTSRMIGVMMKWKLCGNVPKASLDLFVECNQHVRGDTHKHTTFFSG